MVDHKTDQWRSSSDHCTTWCSFIHNICDHYIMHAATTPSTTGVIHNSTSLAYFVRGDRQSTWSRGVTNLVLASLPVLYLPICYIYVHNKRLAGSIIADYSDWLINSFSLEITCKASYLPCWPVMAALPRTRLEWAMCSQYEWRSIPIKAIIHEPFWKPLS